MDNNFWLFVSIEALSILKYAFKSFPDHEWKITNDRKNADAFILTEEEATQSSLLEEIGIKPAIFIKPQNILPEFELKDFTASELGAVLNQVKGIVEKIRLVPLSNFHDIFLGGLIFLWSRGGLITPLVTRNLSKGYGYLYFDTVLNILFPRNSLSGRDIFSFLEGAGLAVSLNHEVAHCCNKCQSILILLRDSCINCSSPHIEEHRLIHHFECGFQSSESMFTVNNVNLLNEYVCPKCRKPLRHFGVDYDKPGVTYHCLSCSQDNSDTQVTVKCLSCEHEGNVDNISRLNILSYEITSFGKKTVLSHEANIFNVRDFLNSHISTVSFSTLLTFVQKISSLRNPLESYVIIAGIDSLGESSESIKVVYELSKEFGKIIRDSDSVAYYNGNIYVFLVDCKEGEVDQIIQLKRNELSKLFTPETVSKVTFTVKEAASFIEQYAKSKV